MNHERFLILCPTRDRPDQAIELYNNIKAHSLNSEICFIVDNDQIALYKDLRTFDCIVEYVPHESMAFAINSVSVKYAKRYKYIGFLGDDHRIRTRGWDLILLSEFQIEKDIGIFYCNDLNQKQNLPTQVVMSSVLIQTMKGIVPIDGIRHLYIDNFWKKVGEDLGILRYFDDVIIEHMHFSVGKNKEDELYKKNNSSERYLEDSNTFHSYIQNEYQGLLFTLQESLKKHELRTLRKYKSNPLFI